MFLTQKQKSKTPKVGIIGEGKMGSGIFNYLLNFDVELVWACSSEADVEKLHRQFIKRIKRAFDAGNIDLLRFDRLINTCISHNLEDLQPCDLIIEAIPEILELKKELFNTLDHIVKQEAIFTSNSSSFNPSQMAPQGSRIEKFAGLHFFYPVPLKNIVEFIVTNNTSTETITVLESFLQLIQRRFLKLDEENSFLLNKIFLAVQNEALIIVNTGQCSFIQMDLLVKKHLFPFGIFDFCDSVGIDIMLTSVQNYTHLYHDKDYYNPIITALQTLANAGKFGIKTGGGFYQYPLGEVLHEEPINAAEIVNRLRQTWHSSAKQLTAVSNIPVDEAKFAIGEYFGLV